MATNSAQVCMDTELCILECLNLLCSNDSTEYCDTNTKNMSHYCTSPW